MRSREPIRVAVLSALFATLAVSTSARADSPDAYFKLRLQQGQVFGNLFSKAVEISGTGFDDYASRYSGSAAYKVLDANPDSPVYDEKYPALGKPDGEITVVMHDAGASYCARDKCAVNRQTSGVSFNPLLWGKPPADIKAGQTWTLDVTDPWEIGPVGKETVRVISLDPTNGTVTLERYGDGSGLSEDDQRKVNITVNGNKVEATVQPGPSHWSGHTVVRQGVIQSDEILIERPVTLVTKTGSYQGVERVYTLLNAMPIDDIDFTKK